MILEKKKTQPKNKVTFLANFEAYLILLEKEVSQHLLLMTHTSCYTNYNIKVRATILAYIEAYLV